MTDIAQMTTPPDTCVGEVPKMDEGGCDFPRTPSLVLLVQSLSLDSMFEEKVDDENIDSLLWTPKRGVNVDEFERENEELGEQCRELEKMIPSIRVERDLLEMRNSKAIDNMQHKIQLLKNENHTLQRHCNDVERKVSVMRKEKKVILDRGLDGIGGAIESSFP
jgi:predicted RNase H-like nuclease (RuvC/YqgF family)